MQPGGRVHPSRPFLSNPPMATQTYCDRDDVEDILSDAAVVAMIDDDEDTVDGAAEQVRVTSAIERSAERMNFWLARRYTLSDLASNDWCKWANATLAALKLSTRRNNPAPQSLVDEANDIMEMCKAVAEQPLAVLPNQPESFDMRPTVSNLRTDRGFWDESPVQVDPETSTGPKPADGIKRYVE